MPGQAVGGGGDYSESLEDQLTPWWVLVYKSQFLPVPCGKISDFVNPGRWSLCQRKKVTSLSVSYRTALGRGLTCYN